MFKRVKKNFLSRKLPRQARKNSVEPLDPVAMETHAGPVTGLLFLQASEQLSC